MGIEDHLMGGKTYPTGLSAVSVVVLGDALVTDAQPPADVAFVFHLVVMNSVVGQGLGQR